MKKQATTTAAASTDMLAQLAQLFTPEQLAAIAAIVSGNAVPTTTQEPAEQPAEPATDERAEKAAKWNAAVLNSIPAENRAKVRARLNKCIRSGYPYARIITNPTHQRDAIRIVCGESKRAKEAAFITCQSKAGETYNNRIAEAKATGKPFPEAPSKEAYYSPAHGGQLYMRDVFFARTEK